MPSLVVRPAYLALLLCLVALPAAGQNEHDIARPDREVLSVGLDLARSVLEPVPLALGDEPTITLSTSQPASQRMWAGDPAEFFKGAFTGFLGHECGHLIANTALNTNFHLKGVKFAVIPFFTIEPGRELSRAVTARALHHRLSRFQCPTHHQRMAPGEASEPARGRQALS